MPKPKTTPIGKDAVFIPMNNSVGTSLGGVVGKGQSLLGLLPIHTD